MMIKLSKSSQPSPLRWVLLGAACVVVFANALFLFSAADQHLRLVISDILVPGIGMASAVCLFFAARGLDKRYKEYATFWWLFAQAQLALSAGDWLWTAYDLILGGSPSPSLADGIYLSSYPLFLWGILQLPSYRHSALEWLKIATDLLIIILASTVAFWNFILGPILLKEGGTLLEMLLALAYPVGDLLLLWGVIVILFRMAEDPARTPFWLIAAGMSSFVISDSLFSYFLSQDLYQSGNWLDLGYIVSYTLFGAAGILQGCQARKAAWSPPEPPKGSRTVSIWRLFLPYMWVALAFSVTLIGSGKNWPMNLETLMAFLGIVTLLVIIRQVLTIRENDKLSENLRLALIQVQSQADALEQTNRKMQAEIRERQRVEEQLAHDAMHDALTKLPNRALFIDRLEQAARKKHRRPDYNYAVLFLDLDSFKVVNDSLGHHAGDRLLIEAAQRLQNCVRSTDTVARLGGDEFVILLDDINDEQQAIKTAERIQVVMAKTIELDGLNVNISVSIGIVVNIAEYEHAEDVLRDADIAMYHAKSQGKARHEIFNSDMRVNAVSRMTLESDLRRALECHELVLYYQPVLSLPDGRLSGFEALVRWIHPERGLVTSGDFIPLAEESGLILPLGEWVLYEACRQAREWQVRFADRSLLRMSVNVSGKQLKQPGFVEMVKNALETSQLPSKNLVLEVTETVCLDDLNLMSETLQQLKDLGVETQIDDFGTGYSSLSYLHTLPVRSVKIDKIFIQAINGSNNQAPEMIRGILALVKDLGINAVAEGIENQGQLEALNRLECAYGQGFLFARPMDRETLEKWIFRHKEIPDNK